MTEKVECYRCDLCDEIYRDEYEAESCESNHIEECNLEVVEVKYIKDEFDNMGGYPQKIRLCDKTRSGHMAEYALTLEGSVEEFDPFVKSIDEV